MRELRVAKSAGFCFGVSRSVKMAEEMLAAEANCYSLGELIHNDDVVQHLRSEGLTVADGPEQIPQGASVIMVSHSMEEIASNVDRLLVMNDSHLVMDATPAEVFAKPEELVQMGLAVPKVTQVLLKLRELGVDVPASAFTVEQAEKLLLPLLKGGKAAC